MLIGSFTAGNINPPLVGLLSEPLIIIFREINLFIAIVIQHERLTGVQFGRFYFLVVFGSWLMVTALQFIGSCWKQHKLQNRMSINRMKGFTSSYMLHVLTKFFSFTSLTFINSSKGGTVSTRPLMTSILHSLYSNESKSILLLTVKSNISWRRILPDNIETEATWQNWKWKVEFDKY